MEPQGGAFMSRRFFLPTQLIHGAGSLKEISKFINSQSKVAIITDEGIVKVGIADKLTTLLETIGCTYGIFSDIPANPRANTVQKAVDFSKKMGADCVVTIGGGSPIDVAKMVAVLLTNEGDLEDYQWKGKQPEQAPAQLIAISTTAGTGTEVTRTAVIVDRDTKKGIGLDALFPAVSIVDAELMVSLPPHLTAYTGMDALTHAIEALIGLNANPVTDSFAAEAIQLLAEYLPKAFTNGQDIVAREKVALASSLAGIAMDQSGLGFVHAMSGPLTSHYDLPHGLSNAVLLPYGLQYNRLAVPEKMAQLAEYLGVNTEGMTIKEASLEAIQAVMELCDDLEIPSNLAGIMKDENDIKVFAGEAINMFLMKNNPRKPRLKDLEDYFAAILKG
jgi:alcohol dehydrogenase class IV